MMSYDVVVFVCVCESSRDGLCHLVFRKLRQHFVHDRILLIVVLLHMQLVYNFIVVNYSNK